MLKKTLAALSILLVLTIAILGWLTYSAANAKPNIAVNYAQEITDLSRRYQPESATQPNRRDEFVALLEDLERIENEFIDDGWCEFELLLFDIADPRTEEKWEWDKADEIGGPEEKKALARGVIDAAIAAGIHERARSLRNIAHTVRLLDSTKSLVEIISTDFPITAHSTRLTRLLATQAALLARKDRPEEALDLLESAFASARLASAEPFMIFGLIALANETYTLDAARLIATEQRLNRDHLLRLERIIGTHDPMPFEYALRSEQLIFMDSVQRVFSDNGNGDGIMLMSEITALTAWTGSSTRYSSNRIFNIVGHRYPSRRETVNTITETFDAAVLLANNPSQPSPFLEKTTMRFDPLQMQPPISDLLQPNVALVTSNTIKIHSERAATQIVIALEIHRLETGRYPNSLDELVAPLPADPLAPDGRLIYTPSDDGSSYSLYGVGRDRTDDGGDEDKDLLFVPVTP